MLPKFRFFEYKYVKFYVFTNLKISSTYSIKKIPSWEANINSFKKFPAYYVTRKFITAFTIAGHLSLIWGTLIHFKCLSSFLMIHFNIILPSRSRSFKMSFLSDLPTEPSMHLYTSLYVLHALSMAFLFFDYPNGIS
jgi:hypothetical protein